MNNGIMTTGQQVALTGVNTVGLISLLAFTIRNFNELNSTIEEIKTEFSNLKHSINENNKRANISFSRLNQKIDESSENVKDQSEFLRKVRKKLTKDPVDEENQQSNVDEISSAINDLLN